MEEKPSDILFKKFENDNQFVANYQPLRVVEILELINCLTPEDAKAIKDNHYNLLHALAWTDVRNSIEGIRTIVKALVKKGTPLNCPNLYSPLHNACALTHLKLAQALIEQRANVRGKDLESNEPLHFAMKVDDQMKDEKIALCRLLLKRGADPSIANSLGELPTNNPYVQDVMLDEKLGGYKKALNLAAGDDPSTFHKLFHPSAVTLKWEPSNSSSADPKNPPKGQITSISTNRNEKRL